MTHAADVALVLVLLPIAFCSAQLVPASIPASTDALQVFALPVGQGDCTIIQCPRTGANHDQLQDGNIVVFDCGSVGCNKLDASRVASWLGTSINRVVAILISHLDRDHYSYLPDIGWNHSSIKAVITGGSLANYGTDLDGKIWNWLNTWQTQK